MESCDVRDPKVEILAAMALEDQDYMRDVEHVRNNSKLDQVERSSELRQLRSEWDQLSVISLDSGDLIIRGHREILIPKAGREELVNELHSTHLSFQGMRLLAKDKFFWPGLTASLERKYINCRECKENSISNHDKKVQVIPENLTMLAPGEQISIDFATYNSQNMLMVKDRVSGMIWAKATKNQTAHAAFEAVMEWAHRMGIPHEVRSDGAGSFRTSFTQLLKSVGNKHVHTSPYNSKSNQAERCVRSIKDVLRRDNIKKVTQKKLDEVSYLINQHVQGDSG